jgi:tetratricopeptide (TPR) repeat protein
MATKQTERTVTCDEVEQRALAEDYLLGRLAEQDRVAFELHYFECEKCYARVDALRAVKEALDAAPAAAAPSPTSWRWLAVAAALLVAVGGAALAWWQIASHDRRGAASSSSAAAPLPAPRTPPIPQDVIQMASIAPPPYAPRRLRSGGQREEFDAAMENYQAGDFAAAAAALETVVQQSPDDEAARFYLGASRALVARWGDAIDVLEPLVARPGSAYAEEAAFITARAHVHLGDTRAAMSALDATIALAGDREADARALRERLARLPAR